MFQSSQKNVFFSSLVALRFSRWKNNSEQKGYFKYLRLVILVSKAFTILNFLGEDKTYKTNLEQKKADFMRIYTILLQKFI